VVAVAVVVVSEEVEEVAVASAVAWVVVAADILEVAAVTLAADIISEGVAITIFVITIIDLISDLVLEDFMGRDIMGILMDMDTVMVTGMAGLTTIPAHMLIHQLSLQYDPSTSKDKHL